MAEQPPPASGRRPSARPPVPGALFTRAQAVAAGWTTGQVDTELRRGRWVALRRGVYRPVAAPDPDAFAEARAGLWVAARAAVAATAAADVVVTHEAAAAYHGLWLVRPWSGPPTVSRARPAGEDRPDTTVAAPLVSRLPASHLTVADGVRVTTLARTAVDLARRGDPLLAVTATDSALRLGATREELAAVVEDCRGWPGARLAREAVRFADARSESALESMGRRRFRELGWPAPQLQVWRRGLVGHPAVRLDQLWPELGVAAEADGMLKYDDPLALRAEKRRQMAIEDSGLEVLRYTYDEVVHRPEDLRRKGERLFERAARRHAS